MSRDHIILPHDRDINSDGVAELAADICQMVRVRDVLIAEAIMAAYLATIHLTRNCGCTGCDCGDKGHAEALKKLDSSTGDAVTKLFNLELEARDL
jgi:hypothetical protein